MDKKYYNYLYSLIILNNINAGSGKKCNKNDNSKKKQENNSNISEESTNKDPDPNEKPEPGKKPDPNKDPKETEEEKKKKLEDKKLNEKADEIINFLNTLDTASKNTNSGIMEATIDKEELKSTIKYFQDLDFSKFSTEEYNDDFDDELYFKLFKIINIEGQDKEKVLNDFLKDAKAKRIDGYGSLIFKKYFEQLFYIGKKHHNLIIVKDKKNNEIHFTLEAENTVGYNDNNENFEKIRIILMGTSCVSKIPQSSNNRSDIVMNLALKLCKTEFIYLIDAIDCAAKVMEHIENSTILLPNARKTLSLVLSSVNKKSNDCYFKYSNDYNNIYSEKAIDINNLYNIEHLIKIEMNERFELKFSEDFGKKKSIFNKDFYKNVPLECSTFEEIFKKLKILDDVNKISEVQNAVLKLIEEDKVYKGENIFIENHKPSYKDNEIQNFKVENIKNSDSPYSYNIYIYKSNNKIKVDIKKWEDNDENKKLEKLINNFKRDLETLIKGTKFSYGKISTLISMLNQNKNETNINIIKQLLCLNFGNLLEYDEWDKLAIKTLYIMIKDDLSSIKISTDEKVEDNSKSFLLTKNEKMVGGMGKFTIQLIDNIII